MSTLLSRLYNWVTDKGNTVKITASRQDAELDQLIAAANRKVLCASSAPSSPIAGQTWVDTTNKLLKVYLNNEWVVHGPVHIAASAAGTPFEGMLWYDTANNLLKAYNGASWNIAIFYPASTAQGDILYLSAADTIARLAAGTSGLFLKTQGAAANPIWAATPKLFVGNLSITATGDQAITGVGFQPKALIFIHIHTGTDSGGTACISIGFSDGTSHHYVDALANRDGAGTGSSTTNIQARTSGGTATCTFTVSALGADGFTINVSAFGGTATTWMYLAIG